jgi:TolB protein
MRLHISAFTFAVALVCGFAADTSSTPLHAAAGDKTIVAFLRPTSIAVESSDPAIAAVAHKAFGSHGNYTLDAKAPTRLVLTKVGGNAVHMVFTSKSKGTQTTQDLSGSTLQEAVLRACDAALERDGQRPFFAGKITFVSDRTGKREIYAGDLFFNSVRQITNYSSLTVSPRWTHSGEEVLYTTYANGNFTDIYAVNVATQKRRGVVVGARGSTTGATANPRTGQIAFSSSASGDMDIYVADASGKGARRFVETPKGNVETDPAWSADGAKLAFVSGVAGHPGIHVVNSGGVALTRIPTPGIPYATEPAWNPVLPGKIAFTYQQGGAYHIGVVDTATRAVTRITTKPDGSYQHPVWCADGRHIVATRVAGTSTRLVLIDTQITSSGDPSPESRKVSILSGTPMANCSEADYFAPTR